jgi:hypothetical protein
MIFFSRHTSRAINLQQGLELSGWRSYPKFTRGLLHSLGRLRAPSPWIPSQSALNTKNLGFVHYV